MKAAKREPLAYFVVACIYIMAAAFGVLVYYYSLFPFWLGLLLADIVATVVVFLFSLCFRNASVYDPYWSVQPIAILIGFCIIEKHLTLAAILPFVAVLLWGVRLTANWAYTFRNLKSENQDWRYTMLEEKTGNFYPLVNFFGIHLVPTLVVYGCVLPVVYLFRSAPKFNVWSAVCFAVCILAILLETVADCTMHKFKKEGGEGFLRKNLWKYSRHPNYLGEILMWWGIYFGTLCVLPQYWWLFVGALANTLLFLFAGIPLADAHQSRKPGFALYKKSTRMLLPLWKKQPKEEETPAPAESKA